ALGDLGEPLHSFEIQRGLLELGDRCDTASLKQIARERILERAAEHEVERFAVSRCFLEKALDGCEGTSRNADTVPVERKGEPGRFDASLARFALSHELLE